YCGDRERAKGFSSCKSKRISARKVNALVLDAILNRILTPHYFNALLDETKKLYVDTETIDAQLSQKRLDLSYTERAIKNLLELVEAFGVNESAKERLRQKELEKLNLMQEIKDIETRKRLIKIEVTPEALALVFEQWRKQIIDADKNNDVAAVRALLAGFIDRVEIESPNVTIRYKYPIQSLIATSPDLLPVGAP
ncbi:MAG TPA: hypothetical protein PLE39_07720, partial [Anaerolineales bacterium]|nr:hypothetical protein [Anaerolineales bacterium]